MPLRLSKLVQGLGRSMHRVRGLSSFGVAHPQQGLCALPPRRRFGSTSRLQGVPGDTDSSLSSPPASPEKVQIHFINRNGEKFSVTAKEGESLLEVVVNQNLSIDGFGACEGTLACSTCHLIFEEEAFRKLGAISDEELDMLDLAFGLTDTSRLGCQIHVKKWMDGLTLHVPREVSDIRKELEVEKQSKQ